jgi:ubiquitin-conjugating enzyme E2 Z
MLKVKRIMGDIKKFNERCLDKEGIYLDYNEDDLGSMKYLIVGPDETPYQGGFYLFDIKISKDYPFKPPSVKYISYSNNVRINPNLYQNGKVCLSVLGTWQGPPWIAAMNLGSLAIDIQIRLNKYPLQNEPGFEKDFDNQTPNYNKITSYYNIELCVIKVLEQIELLPKKFQEIIKTKFIENYPKYIEYLDSIKDMEGEIIYCRYANSKCEYRPSLLKDKINALYQMYKD